MEEEWSSNIENTNGRLFFTPIMMLLHSVPNGLLFYQADIKYLFINSEAKVHRFDLADTSNGMSTVLPILPVRRDIDTRAQIAMRRYALDAGKNTNGLTPRDGVFLMSS